MASLKTVLLIAFILAASGQQTAAMCPSCPKECCFAVRKGRPLPRKIMASFYKITDDCYLNAIVLVTKAGKQICVDPEATWVRTAMTELPERK